MVNELRKICSETYLKILVLIILAVTILLAVIPISSFSAFQSAGGALVEGKAAIQLAKKQYENSRGKLMTPEVNKVLAYYQSNPSADESYVNSGIKYPGSFELLINAYSSLDLREEVNLYKLKNANDFYQRNIMQIQARLEQSNNRYQEWEKSAILQRAEAIEKPFVIDFDQQWRVLYTTLSLLFLTIGISAIMIGSRLFSYEKEKKMDLILTSISRRKLRRVGKNKVLALLTFLTLQFAVSTIVLSVIFLSVTGISAWSNQIQCQYFTSIYPLTYGGAYCLFLFMGWLSTLAIGLVTATINCFTQKSYLSLIIGIMVTFSPLIIIKLDALPIFIKKFFQVQPVNGFMTEKSIESLQLYKFFAGDILATTAIISYSLLLIGIGFLIIRGRSVYKCTMK